MNLSRNLYLRQGVATALLILMLCGGLLACGGTNGPAPDPGPAPSPPDPPPPPTEPVVAECDASRTPKTIGVPEEPDDPRVTIVGGIPAVEDSWPWAAAIVFQREDGSLFQYCGGSLIASDWVLTAAHCEVQNGDQVIIGRRDLRTEEGVVHDIDFVLTHNQYEPETNENDIALVKLATASDQETVGLIDVGDTGAQAGDDSTIIGWGRLSEGGPASPELQQVTVPVVSNTDCEAGYAPDGVSITGDMVCAGLPEGEKDSCQGDSGGPLMVPGAGDGAWQQAGVVSFGIGCARAGKFGVYTRVSQFLPWVDACQADPPA